MQIPRQSWSSIRNLPAKPELSQAEQLGEELESIVQQALPGGDFDVVVLAIKRPHLPFEKELSNSVRFRVYLNGETDTPDNMLALHNDAKLIDYIEGLAFLPGPQDTKFTVELAGEEFLGRESDLELEAETMEQGLAEEAGLETVETIDLLAPDVSIEEQQTRAATIDDIERLASRLEQRLAEVEQRHEQTLSHEQEIG